MDILLIVLIALIVLSAGGWGYGRYYATPVEPAVGPAPYANPLGLLAVLLIVGLLVMMLGGWWHPFAGPVP